MSKKGPPKSTSYPRLTAEPVTMPTPTADTASWLGKKISGIASVFKGSSKSGPSLSSQSQSASTGYGSSGLKK